MCWWNEPAYYKSTERRRHPGDEASAHWRKVDRNLMKISLMWSRKRLELLWVCPSFSVDVSRFTTIGHAHLYKMRFISSKSSPHTHTKKRQTYAKKPRMPSSRYTVTMESKTPLTEGKEWTFKNLRLHDEIKATVVSILSSEPRLINVILCRGTLCLALYICTTSYLQGLLS